MSNKFEIVHLDEAEDAEIVVCIRLTRPLRYPDNVIALCSRCGQAIQHRPHIPKRPALVCFPCIEPDLKQESAKGEVQVKITAKTATEFAKYLRKKSEN